MEHEPVWKPKVVDLGPHMRMHVQLYKVLFSVNEYAVAEDRRSVTSKEWRWNSTGSVYQRERVCFGIVFVRVTIEPH